MTVTRQLLWEKVTIRLHTCKSGLQSDSVDDSQCNCEVLDYRNGKEAQNVLTTLFVLCIVIPYIVGINGEFICEELHPIAKTEQMYHLGIDELKTK